MLQPLWLAPELAEIFEELSIPYYVTGAIASSLQGEMRPTQDLDLVVNLQSKQIKPLLKKMNSAYYISDVGVAEAIAHKTSWFNVTHIKTTDKANVFVMRDEPFAHSKMQRRQLLLLEEQNKSIYTCSPEDIILQKLLCSQTDKIKPEKHKHDIQGVIQRHRERLDFDYLWRWADTLDVIPLLTAAFIEAQL
jgi:hypothetical protein